MSRRPGLNRAEREDLARFILRIKDELGLAMIWIEHDMQMVADLADRLHVLDYGKTLAIGSARRCWRSRRRSGLSRHASRYGLMVRHAYPPLVAGQSHVSLWRRATSPPLPLPACGER